MSQIGLSGGGRLSWIAFAAFLTESEITDRSPHPFPRGYMTTAWDLLSFFPEDNWLDLRGFRKAARVRECPIFRSQKDKVGILNLFSCPDHPWFHFVTWAPLRFQEPMKGMQEVLVDPTIQTGHAKPVCKL